MIDIRVCKADPKKVIVYEGAGTYYYVSAHNVWLKIGSKEIRDWVDKNSIPTITLTSGDTIS